MQKSSVVIPLAFVAVVLPAGCAIEPTPHDDDIAPRLDLDAGELRGLARDGDFFVSPALESDAPVSRVSIMLNLVDGATDAVSLQARDLDSGEVVDAVVVWREDEAMVMNADFESLASRVELRVPIASVASIHGIAWEMFVPAGDANDNDDAEIAAEIDAIHPSAEQGLAAWLENGNVRGRGAWNARSSRGCSQDSGKYRMAIHHTVTARTLNGSYARQLRQIQSMHMDGRGYCDIAYHLLVTADGTRWEGRPIHRLGAHTGGFNTGNVGIALVGCFQPGACGGASTTPPTAMVNATARLVRRVAKHYDFPINSSRVKGHRQWAGGTACPGDKVLDLLPTIRSRARNNNFPGPG